MEIAEQINIFFDEAEKNNILAFYPEHSRFCAQFVNVIANVYEDKFKEPMETLILQNCTIDNLLYYPRDILYVNTYLDLTQIFRDRECHMMTRSTELIDRICIGVGPTSSIFGGYQEEPK